MNPGWQIPLVRPAALLSVLLACSSAFTAKVESGFFKGHKLVAVKSAPESLLTSDRSAVLIFAADERSIEPSRNFDIWSKTGKHRDISRYAVAVAKPGVPVEVMEEVAAQRELSVPVFVTNADILMGQSFRIVFLENGQAVETMTDASQKSLDLAAARVLGAEDSAPAVPPAASILPPAETPTTSATPPPLPGESSENTLTRLGEAAGTTVSIKVEEPQTPPSQSEGKYLNSRYNMSVEFPPGWNYEKADNGDGAVAVPPPGVQLDLRIWASHTDLPAGKESAFSYIDQALDALSRKYGAKVNVQRRFSVDDGRYNGADITYTYSRPLKLGSPGAGSLRQLGRMQVFVTGGVVKALSAEGSSGEFKALEPVIEPFFLSFSPDDTAAD